MQDPFVGQDLALATKPAVVLFLGSRRFDHRTHPRLAALVRQQRTKQRLAVDSISLLSPASTRGCNRGRIDDVAFDPFILQHTVNPEAVQPHFLHDDNRERFPSPRQRLLPKSRKARQQRADVSGGYAVLRQID